MRMEIKLNLDNETFRDDLGELNRQEIGLILGHLIGRIVEGHNNIILSDSNGNSVGEFWIIPDND